MNVYDILSKLFYRKIDTTNDKEIDKLKKKFEHELLNEMIVTLNKLSEKYIELDESHVMHSVGEIYYYLSKGVMLELLKYVKTEKTIEETRNILLREANQIAELAKKNRKELRKERGLKD